ncbi:glutathione S-transferase [Scleroderma yunnanense]
MAPIGKLYGHPLQPQTNAILSAAAISGLEIESLPFEFGVTNKSPEFLQKFPLAKIPAFESNDGLRLIEGAAIARYVSSLVPEAGLLGRNARETALVDQWVHFAESEIQIPASTIYIGLVPKYLPAFGQEQYNFHQERLARSLKFLEDHLATRPSGFLVNDDVTLADIILATSTRRVGQTICGATEREQLYPRVFAHYERVVSDKRISALFAESKFVETPLTVQAQ